MAADALDLVIAGEPMQALAERALYWPARRRLLIADLHLGKGDVFRRAGIAVPSGGTADDLERLARLIAKTDAQAVWILGDLLHGPVPDAAWLAQWRTWRRQHAAVEIAVLPGNHDRMLRESTLDIRCLSDPQRDGPFVFMHAPETQAGAHAIGGHLHPLASVPGVRRRWPVFWLRPSTTVLPAFSAFTAGVAVAPASGERLLACVETSMIEIPVRPARPRLR